MATTTIPEHLMRDRYWKPVLYLFSEHGKLSSYFTTEYFDLENGLIHIRKIKMQAKPWSESEKFMLHLALHLFNESNKLPSNGIGDMAYLDDFNTELAMKAIQLRFS